MTKRSPLAEKLDEVRQRIADAAVRAKRDPEEITLIAVTKSAAPEQIREIIQLGVADLGESRVQVLTQRAPHLNEFHQRQLNHGVATVAPRLRWHLVGHLQRNKARHVLPVANLIHSVDTLRLAEEIENQSARLNQRTPILLQVNASEEASKHGVAVGAAVHLAEQIDTMSHLQFLGLMTMAPLGGSPAQVRQAFSRTRELFDEMRWHKIGGGALRHLSMGMSGDFEVAIEEGATMVRIGSLLFGGETADDHAVEED